MAESNNEMKKSFSGYKIGVIILAVAIVVVSVLFFMRTKNLKQESTQLSAEREAIRTELTATMNDLNAIKTDNVQLSDSLNMQRHRADSLLARLDSERKMNSQTIAQYKKELGTLRTIMQRYVQQIDELNKANAKLTEENLEYRSQIVRTQERAEKAEERAREQGAIIRTAEILKASNIYLAPIRNNDREIARMKRAQKLRIDFTLNANNLAKAGQKTIYARIIDPSGYPLSASQENIFEFNGKMIPYTASRVIDYANKDLNVSIYYPVEGLEAGVYTVEIFVENDFAGAREIETK